MLIQLQILHTMPEKFQFVGQSQLCVTSFGLSQSLYFILPILLHCAGNLLHSLLPTFTHFSSLRYTQQTQCSSDPRSTIQMSGRKVWLSILRSQNENAMNFKNTSSKEGKFGLCWNELYLLLAQIPNQISNSGHLIFKTITDLQSLPGTDSLVQGIMIFFFIFFFRNSLSLNQGLYTSGLRKWFKKTAVHLRLSHSSDGCLGRITGSVHVWLVG